MDVKTLASVKNNAKFSWSYKYFCLKLWSTDVHFWNAFNVLDTDFFSIITLCAFASDYFWFLWITTAYPGTGRTSSKENLPKKTFFQGFLGQRNFPPKRFLSNKGSFAQWQFCIRNYLSMKSLFKITFCKKRVSYCVLWSDKDNELTN